MYRDIKKRDKLKNSHWMMVWVMSMLVINGCSIDSDQTTEMKPSIVTLEQASDVESVPSSEEPTPAPDAEELTSHQDAAPVADAVVGKEVASEVLPEATSKKEPSEANKKTSSVEPVIQPALISWGYEVPKKQRSIEAIIIHSSYDAIGDDPYDKEGLIQEYKQYGVAAHYLIDRKGSIYQLVLDKHIAYHAGKSTLPDGGTNVNERSIGIELMNTEKDTFTDKQYTALNGLLSQLKDTYDITHILGHDQIAPGRKTDPWNIEWAKVKK